LENLQGVPLLGCCCAEECGDGGHLTPLSGYRKSPKNGRCSCSAFAGAIRRKGFSVSVSWVFSPPPAAREEAPLRGAAAFPAGTLRRRGCGGREAGCPTRRRIPGPGRRRLRSGPVLTSVGGASTPRMPAPLRKKPSAPPKVFPSAPLPEVTAEPPHPFFERFRCPYNPAPFCAGVGWVSG
jgi:hypothetical protein